MDGLNRTKLHEAIEQVLNKSESTLALAVITEKINTLDMYHRKDGGPVPSSRILARADSCTSLFDILDGRVSIKAKS